MSVSSAVQSVSGGLASVLAGFIVSNSATGEILHFDMLGYVVSSATLITLVMMYFIQKVAHERLALAAVPSAGVLASLEDGSPDPISSPKPAASKDTDSGRKSG